MSFAVSETKSLLIPRAARALDAATEAIVLLFVCYWDFVFFSLFRFASPDSTASTCAEDESPVVSSSLSALDAHNPSYKKFIRDIRGVHGRLYHTLKADTL
jgi:hypothetical protein